MTNFSSLSLTDVATLAGIAASIFAVLNVASRWLVEYLSAKFAPAKNNQVEQNYKCKADHSNINSMMVSQGAHMVKMQELQGKAIDAMNQASHVAELRHAIVLAELKSLTKMIEFQMNHKD